MIELAYKGFPYSLNWGKVDLSKVAQILPDKFTKVSSTAIFAIPVGIACGLADNVNNPSRPILNSTWGKAGITCPLYAVWKPYFLVAYNNGSNVSYWWINPADLVQNGGVLSSLIYQALAPLLSGFRKVA